MMRKGSVLQKDTVTESGVQLLAAQKPIKRQSWWKGKFALFWMSAMGVGRTPVQRPTPPTNDNRGQELSQTEGEGSLQKQHRQL